MTIYTKVEIESVKYSDINNITIKKTMSDYSAISVFEINLDNTNGKFKDVFNLNDDIIIYADKDIMPATTKIFRGVIEDIKFKGLPNKERITISGRDYSVRLLDNIVKSRIFINQEISDIVKSLIVQNLNTSITTDNVNSTGITLDKITFNNISIYDALKKLAELSGYYFYIDEDLVLHFEEKNNISSSLIFDSTNVTNSNFRISDSDIYNYIEIIGERQLTGVQDIITTSTGSEYNLTYKPYNTRVIISGTTNTVLQPGGIFNIHNPKTTNSKYLVDFDNRNIITTSGLTAGNNIQSSGTVVIFDYDKSVPLIKVKSSPSSISLYGKKDKKIIDKNIKDGDEANVLANNFLEEHKNPKIAGNITVNNVLYVTPGNTAIVNLPNNNQNNEVYSILQLTYNFNKINNLSNNVLSISLNKKIDDFINIFKEQILKLRALEGAETDTSIIDIQLASANFYVSGTHTVVSRSIGSGFYFHVPNHNLLNSPSSLLGDMRAGSTVWQNGNQI